MSVPHILAITHSLHARISALEQQRSLTFMAATTADQWGFAKIQGRVDIPAEVMQLWMSALDNSDMAHDLFTDIFTLGDRCVGLRRHEHFANMLSTIELKLNQIQANQAHTNDPLTVGPRSVCSTIFKMFTIQLFLRHRASEYINILTITADGIRPNQPGALKLGVTLCIPFANRYALEGNFYGHAFSGPMGECIFR